MVSNAERILTLVRTSVFDRSSASVLNSAFLCLPLGQGHGLPNVHAGVTYEVESKSFRFSS